MLLKNGSDDSIYLQRKLFDLSILDSFFNFSVRVVQGWIMVEVRK